MSSTDDYLTRAILGAPRHLNLGVPVRYAADPQISDSPGLLFTPDVNSEESVQPTRSDPIEESGHGQPATPFVPVAPSQPWSWWGGKSRAWKVTAAAVALAFVAAPFAVPLLGQLGSRQATPREIAPPVAAANVPVLAKPAPQLELPLGAPPRVAASDAQPLANIAVVNEPADLADANPSLSSSAPKTAVKEAAKASPLPPTVAIAKPAPVVKQIAAKPVAPGANANKVAKSKEEPPAPAMILDAQRQVGEAPAATKQQPGEAQPTRKFAQPLESNPATPSTQPPAQGGKASSVRVTIVDIAPDGTYALITNPETRLPQRFSAGQKIFTGETIQKIDPKSGKVTLDSRSISME
jgi:hypothetical protein